MDQTRKAVVLAILDGYEESTDIEMSLPDVLAIVKRLGKLHLRMASDIEQSDDDLAVNPHEGVRGSRPPA